MLSAMTQRFFFFFINFYTGPTNCRTPLWAARWEAMRPPTTILTHSKLYDGRVLPPSVHKPEQQTIGFTDDRINLPMILNKKRGLGIPLRVGRDEASTGL